MTFFHIGPIKKIVIFGAVDFLDEIHRFCNENNIELLIITSPSQRQYCKVKSPAQIMVMDLLEIPKIRDFLDLSHVQKNELMGLSFGARWIFKNELIDDVFYGNLINFHGTRLPHDKGGGGFSWRIMRGDRLGSLLAHLVDEGIDTGPIILQEDYVIPKELTTPSAIAVDYNRRLKIFVENILTSVAKSPYSFKITNQVSGAGSYFPRLLTEIHGWINWDWEPEYLVRFIDAFDDPYSGAKTKWKGRVAQIKKVQLHVGEFGFHPFQSGIVIRKGQNWAVVALKDAYSLIVEHVHGEDGTDLLPFIREGDRFNTSSRILDRAKSTRVMYDSKGPVIVDYSKEDVSS
jgi:methionyl-tRNA formyltransferase